MKIFAAFCILASISIIVHGADNVPSNIDAAFEAATTTSEHDSKIEVLLKKIETKNAINAKNAAKYNEVLGMGLGSLAKAPVQESVQQEHEELLVLFRKKYRFKQFDAKSTVGVLGVAHVMRKSKDSGMHVLVRHEQQSKAIWLNIDAAKLTVGGVIPIEKYDGRLFYKSDKPITETNDIGVTKKVDVWKPLPDYVQLKFFLEWQTRNKAAK